MSSTSTTTFDRSVGLVESPMKIPIYQVDAFTTRTFGGNPAAVCPMQAWIPDATMQAIAAENNVPATAFIVGCDGDYQIRWFTPTAELELCGHATLASAYVVFNALAPGTERIRFASKSGPIAVRSHDGLIEIEFPALPLHPVAPPHGLAAALGNAPLETLEGKTLVALFAAERDVRELTPDLEALKRMHPYGVIVSAPGDGVDFVSRFFAPNRGVAEDPVTGSAHCALTPYWSKRLGKNRLHARQVSARGGELVCEMAGDRVLLSGTATPYLQGTIEL